MGRAEKVPGLLKEKGVRHVVQMGERLSADSSRGSS